jgi:hypothetical protein
VDPPGHVPVAVTGRTELNVTKTDNLFFAHFFSPFLF